MAASVSDPLKEILSRYGVNNLMLENELIRMFEAQAALLAKVQAAIEYEDKRCGRVYGPLGEALAQLRGTR